MLLVEGGKACRAQSRTLRRGVGVRLLLLSSCGTAGFGCGSGAMLPGEEAPAVPTQHPRHPRQVRPPSSAGLRLRPLGPRGALLHSRLAGIAWEGRTLWWFCPSQQLSAMRPLARSSPRGGMGRRIGRKRSNCPAGIKPPAVPPPSLL